MVRSERKGNTVFYEARPPKISELLVIARTFLADTLGARRDQLRAVIAAAGGEEVTFSTADPPRARVASPDYCLNAPTTPSLRSTS